MLELMNEYSARISDLMTEKGWGRTLTSTKIGISYQGLKKVLDGGGELSPDNLFAAAKAFNVNAYWLHTGHGARGTWSVSLGESAPESARQNQTASADGLALAKFYDDLPEDRELRRQIFRKASALLLQLEPTASSAKTDAPGATANPEKHGA